jgi:hypothetical protein
LTHSNRELFSDVDQLISALGEYLQQKHEVGGSCLVDLSIDQFMYGSLGHGSAEIFLVDVDPGWIDLIPPYSQRIRASLQREIANVANILIAAESGLRQPMPAGRTSLERSVHMSVFDDPAGNQRRIKIESALAAGHRLDARDWVRLSSDADRNGLVEDPLDDSAWTSRSGRRQLPS